MSRKFTGKTWWFGFSSENKPEEAPITEAVLRDDGNTLVIDIEYSTPVTVTMKQTSPDVFEGEFQFRGAHSGPVAAVVLFSTQRGLLSGRWVENGTDYKWFAQLLDVSSELNRKGFRHRTGPG